LVNGCLGDHQRIIAHVGYQDSPRNLSSRSWSSESLKLREYNFLFGNQLVVWGITLHW